MMKAKPHTGNDLKNYRLIKGLTQQELAAQFFVHRNILGAWERRGDMPLPLRGQRTLNDLGGFDEVQK